jgi:hypothetical protein
VRNPTVGVKLVAGAGSGLFLLSLGPGLGSSAAIERALNARLQSRIASCSMGLIRGNLEPGRSRLNVPALGTPSGSCSSAQAMAVQILQGPQSDWVTVSSYSITVVMVYGYDRIRV